MAAREETFSASILTRLFPVITNKHRTELIVKNESEVTTNAILMHDIGNITIYYRRHDGIVHIFFKNNIKILLNRLSINYLYTSSFVLYTGVVMMFVCFSVCVRA